VAASFFLALLTGLVTTGFIQKLILVTGSLAIIFSFIMGWVEYFLHNEIEISEK
jgi:hypothetical protein